VTEYRHWLQPPRSLFLALLSTTLLAVGSLAWLGWRLAKQERLLAAQREQARLEMTVRSIAASWKEKLALIHASPEVWPPSEVPSGVLALRFDEETFRAHPPSIVPYVPFAITAPEPPEEPFLEVQRQEVISADFTTAAQQYRILSQSNDTALRAGALLRLARCLRALGRETEARQAYQELSRIEQVRIAGVPAALLGLHQLKDWTRLRRELAASRWQLTRGQFLFYWEAASGAEPENVNWAEAAAESWRTWKESRASQGERQVGAGFQLVWRGNTGLLFPTASIEQAARAMLRPEPGSAKEQERLLLTGLSAVALFLLCGTYFIARAMRREIEVARLKQDFVSAVSHEFRTPLTSIRQFSEILQSGRAPSEERRRQYYAALIEQAGKLQRLVETLLNFGSMESGSRQYRMQAVDVAEVVAHVAAEFPLAGSGRRIEYSGAPLFVPADREALAVALRNLIDNALKYSPGRDAVWVTWRREGNHAIIDVRDEGAGIPPGERHTIFQKFVRGSAAAATHAGGSGVGLAMVRHIAEAHGATVEVESKPGVGSTFTLVLPLAGEAT
jgi:signal transduction histidine kinase